MTIFFDNIHLVSDHSLQELHSFAKSIGLKRQWFQNKRKPHYDLTTKRMAKKAFLAGAVLTNSREIVQILKGKKPSFVYGKTTDKNSNVLTGYFSTRLLG